MGENEKTLLKIIENISVGSRFILGIDGLSRSGKTTLVKKLSHKMKEKKISFHVFHIDDYIVEREKRYNTGNEEWYEYYNLQWDTDWLSRNFFGKLKSANHLILPVYDDESNTHSQQEVQLSNPSVIIVEGVFLQRKEWRSFYDYVVYLDCPRSKRFLRESEDTQKNITKFENRYWKAEEFYVNTEAPDKNADLVLKG
ncbi:MULTISPECIES: kinase [unclassified Bacillus (in: firmicutes)]|uniref:kinase n=1 Tax=unclassified Bacillus (in: firmicutes) TaxID=185979 RepID=UPI0008E1ECA6|nr:MULTISPECIES: kinase [unclassified Bacillus (in: firmicutes)]SFJ44886.1 uridine kinase [Bacillus sp. 71mf]SFT03618.1 uridine kinase [Bacillus sp. 103mf]